MELLDHFLKLKVVSTDTRNIKPNSIFFSLKGPNFNGNKFVKEAIKKGASLVVIDEIEYQNENTILVKDALKSLQDLARDYRIHLGLKVIAITGSNGKTTTKELLVNALSKKYNTYGTPGNFNNHIGVPLTLLNLQKETEIAVIEMGDNKPGDIAELCEIALPDYGFVTNVGKDHLEGYGTMSKNVRTKDELHKYLSENNNFIFYNSNDQYYNDYTINTDHSFDISSLLSKKTIKQNASNPFVNFSIKNEYYSTNLIGDYNLINITTTYSIAHHFKVSSENIGNAISNYEPENNRSQFQKTDNNQLVLDAYNSNPSSLELALSSFSKLDSSLNKGVILGDMLELGGIANEEHISALKQLERMNLHQVILCGSLFFQYKEDYPYLFFKSTNEAKVHIKNNRIEKALLLLKGSRGNKLEELVSVL